MKVSKQGKCRLKTLFTKHLNGNAEKKFLEAIDSKNISLFSPSFNGKLFSFFFLKNTRQNIDGQKCSQFLTKKQFYITKVQGKSPKFLISLSTFIFSAARRAKRKKIDI